MAAPLEDVLVVDLSQGMAGAVATMLLADYGAEVIRVEPTSGDPFRSIAGSAVWHRGKRSVALDIGMPKAQEALHRLLERADVLLETSQPGAMAGVGLDYESVHALYPRMIYCSLTGYGQEGTDRGRPAYDGLVQARVGLQGQRWGAQAGHREGPLYMAFPAPSYAGGFLACAGILSALHVRESTGVGQHVDTSLADGALSMQRWGWAENPTPSGPPPATTAVPRRGLGMMVRFFRCADGEYLWIHTGARGVWERLARALGMEEFLTSLDWERLSATESRQRIEAEVGRAVASKPRAEWMQLLDAADVPNRPVLCPGQAFEDEQINAIDMVASLEDPELGMLWQVGLPLKFALSPGRLTRGAPRVGEHTREVLGELGFSDREIEEMGQGV